MTTSNSKNEAQRYNPPKEYLPPLASRFINWLESMNDKYSIVENQPIFTNDQFPWANEIEADWMKIRKELDEVMKDREKLPNLHDIIEQGHTISEGNSWKTYLLAGLGIECEKNRERCPETVKLLDKIPNVLNAYFSILSPGKHIPPHMGPYNGLVKYHLGLLMPEPREKCKIRINDQIKVWEEGKTLIFDDTYNHEVWNDTDGHRVVLLVDFLRPLKFPFNLINKFVFSVSVFAPFVTETAANFKKWENKYYNEGQKN